MYISLAQGQSRLLGVWELRPSYAKCVFFSQVVKYMYMRTENLLMQPQAAVSANLGLFSECSTWQPVFFA